MVKNRKFGEKGMDFFPVASYCLCLHQERRRSGATRESIEAECEKHLMEEHGE